MTGKTRMSPAVRRYMKRFIPSMLLYIVVLTGSILAIKHLHPGGPLLWALAVAPALPILAVIAVMGRYVVEETDEFLRLMAVQAMLWGIGVTLALATVWGFLENADLVPHVSSFLMFPIFCGAMGLAQPFIWRRYR